VLALGAALPLAGYGQGVGNGPRPVTFRMLSLGAPVSNVFYDYQGKPIRLSAGSTSLSSPRRAEAGQEVELYREIPPVAPSTTPTKEKLNTFQLGNGGPYLVFMQVNPADNFDIRSHVVEDSWQEHPLGTIRIFNFSKRKTMAKIGDKIVELNPGQTALFDYAEGKHQTWLQAAVWEDGEWTLRTSNPQVTLPSTRSSIVLLDQPPSRDRPNTRELMVRNFFEHAPQPMTPSSR
jgi:hypothetical protein